MASRWIICASFALVVIVTAEGNKFCYNDDDGCGPNTWPELCRNGQRQSPIDLRTDKAGKTAHLQLGNYRGSFFRIQNSGHSVAFDFVGQNGIAEGPSSGLFPFPDAYNQSLVRNYKLGSGHFHWGMQDNDGSEHTINNKTYAMELHLVHYLSAYDNVSHALGSNDSNALAVLGTFFELPSGPFSRPKNSAALAPIIRHITEVEKKGDMIREDEALDLTSVVNAGLMPNVYMYKGSLTTPDCNEQVNWYVLRNPAGISHDDIESFRSIRDDEDNQLLENHRPRQQANGRKVVRSIVGRA